MNSSSDKQLEDTLLKSENAIIDDGFSESVLDRLPKKRRADIKSRCWTLAGAAAMGSILTLILAPPIEKAFNLYRITHGYHTTVLAVLITIVLLAVPTSWVLFSQLDRDS